MSASPAPPSPLCANAGSPRTFFRRDNSIPLALDDTAYRIELTYMSAVWLFTCLSWRLDEALKRDEKWGIWSIRGRLLWYLEAVISMTDATNVLPGLNRTASSWLLELQRR